MILSHRQPQSQLAIRAGVAIDEIFQPGRNLAIFIAEPAQKFLRDDLRDVFRPVGASIESHHAQRIGMLATDQIADGGLIISPVQRS